MTADVELLPLPELPRQVEGYSSDYWEASQVEEYATDYARACVAHATAAKDAEIEALRAEVEKIQALRKHHRARHKSYKRRHADAKARAEQLAEALRECRPFVAYAYDRGIVGAELAGRNLDAALDQENSDG